ncbi:MAG: hypothetical protein H0T43_12010, partial [Solirubrobacterales bacterium]|nr:hypothetical protein [Solirubrobacterales bacterium]
MLAAASRPVTVSDPRGDAPAALDMQRLSLQRAGDGRLRASVTFAGTVRPRDLLAASGPPGSVCLRVWT